MDDAEDDARFSSKHYSNFNNPSLRARRPNRKTSYSIKSSYKEYNDDDSDEENLGLSDDSDDQEEDEDEDDYQNGYYRVSASGVESSRRQPKKRKLETLVSNYEFAPRSKPKATKDSYGLKDQPFDWDEHSTFVFLEVWGDRFLQLGRKSLRADDWAEVAEKVSESCKSGVTDMQCRFRLDALKKKYKKEKGKMEEKKAGGGIQGKWVFFKKMDMLFSSKKQNYGLPCGVDSGEYVFMSPKVYLDRSNASDEMMDSPGESESDQEDHDDRKEEDDSSFRVLAESVQKFGEIFEKVESSKRQQMVELERMRMDFQRDLELQKKQILEKAQAEITQIRHGDSDDTDVSLENISG